MKPSANRVSPCPEKSSKIGTWGLLVISTLGILIQYLKKWITEDNKTKRKDFELWNCDWALLEFKYCNFSINVVPRSIMEFLKPSICPDCYSTNRSESHIQACMQFTVNHSLADMIVFDDSPSYCFSFS